MKSRQTATTIQRATLWRGFGGAGADRPASPAAGTARPDRPGTGTATPGARAGTRPARGSAAHRSAAPRPAWDRPDRVGQGWERRSSRAELYATQPTTRRISFAS
jgi:hypothetical protein